MEYYFMDKDNNNEFVYFDNIKEGNSYNLIIGNDDLDIGILHIVALQGKCIHIEYLEVFEEFRHNEHGRDIVSEILSYVNYITGDSTSYKINFWKYCGGIFDEDTSQPKAGLTYPFIIEG